MDDDSPHFGQPSLSGSGSLLEQAQKLKDVKRLIESGNKIEAIKRFREIFGCGLKEAKDAVENIEAGRPVVFTDFHDSTPAFDGAEVAKVAKTVGFSFLGIVLAILLFTGIIVAVVIYSVSSAINRSISSIKSTANSMVKTASTKPAATEAKPSFATETFRFGSEGMGAGQFKDNRSVAVDSDGNIYSAEYTGGRVQEFDPQGNFVKLIMVDEEKPLLDMLADRKGNLFVLMYKTIYRFDTKTGESRGNIERYYAQDMALGLDGLIYLAVEGGDIVAMTPEGKEVKRLKNIAAQANLKRPDIQNITLDGDGNIYAIDRASYYILKFSKDGKYLNRFGGRAEPGKKGVKGVFDFFPNDIAVDGKGNVFVSQVSNILVFNTDGAYIDSFNSNQAFGMAITDKNELWVACRPNVVKYEVK
jgi:sugar lactone lactonase YvrE